MKTFGIYFEIVLVVMLIMSADSMFSAWWMFGLIMSMLIGFYYWNVFSNASEDDINNILKADFFKKYFHIDITEE